MTVAYAPAKIIITGEHFVVHGQPALAAAVNLYSKASVEPGPPKMIEISSPSLGVVETTSINTSNEKNIPTCGGSILEPLRLLVERVMEKAGQREVGLRLQVASQIPVGVGLGSSASTAVSTAAAVAKFLNLELDKREICELALVQERFIHKKPSGIDPTTAAYGGMILFKVGEPPIHIRPCNQIGIVIGNTGTARSTGDLVTKVGRHVEGGDADLGRITHSAGQLTLKAVEAYKERDFNGLGRIMNENHKLLMQIGISTPQIDRLVEGARDAGALGAKLTGAGGGGCMIALSRLEDRDKIAEAIVEAGGQPYLVEIDRFGVRSNVDKPKK